jgi:plastocyanin
VRRKRVAAAVGVGAAVVGFTVATSGADAIVKPTAAMKPVKITVTASDFSFKLSKTTVPKGVPIVFTIINKGPSPHDWDVEGTPGTPVKNPSSKTVFKFTFKKAGSFRYVCTVPRHAEFGMTGYLNVK